MADKAAPSAWAYPKALEAAIQLNKHSTVTEIVRDMQDRDIKFTVFDYTEIIRMFAEAKQWTLAHSMVSAMQKHKMNPPSDTYNLLLTGCGNDRYWNIVIEAYTAMSDDRKPSLDAKALSSVLLAFSQAENEELQERTVTICNDHKKTCKPFPYEMALIALLEAKQHQEVISLAAEATHHGFELTPLMHHMVVKAHLGSGSMEQARQLLDENAKRLSNISVECYRELITYYAEVREDTLKASKMCVLMMENNTNVSVNDWRTALELALQLPDRTTYWELRKLLRVHEVPLSEFRSHLLLLEDDHELDRYR
ncbi:putative mitochondrial protein [Phytophthora megakarya]|uniref:Putative mitochondrial protein n=1 Tax=Phytophthora megakarya TaxID=4795 RepID=A0A225WPE4_9STRA|nr:putative mitochondrial protein [Phytophthora megakarya]